MGAHMYCIFDPFSCPHSELYRLLHDCETESSDAENKIRILSKKKISLVLQFVWKQLSSCITDMMHDQSRNLK